LQCLGATVEYWFVQKLINFVQVATFFGIHFLFFCSSATKLHHYLKIYCYEKGGGDGGVIRMK